MNNLRIERKFVYQAGDNSYEYFLINGMFKKIYPKRRVNSIYFDNESLKNVGDNFNGFSNRVKIRLRWYNNLYDSEVYLEEKKKINFSTIKKVKSVGKFKNFNELSNFINSDLQYDNFFLKNKYTIFKTLYVSYNRDYFEEKTKKLRVTIDKNLRIYKKFKSNFIDIDKNIVEFKYHPKNSNFVNNFALYHDLKNRNQKFSKYVNSFIDLNESGLA